MKRRKITLLQECEIIYRLLKRETYKSIARDYGISHQTIAKIVRAWPLFFWNVPRVYNFNLRHYGRYPGSLRRK